MKKIIFFVLAFIFSAFVTPIVRYYLTGILKIWAAPEWLIAVLVPVVTWFIVFMLLMLLFGKPLMLQELSKALDFVPVTPDEFPKLDVKSLRRYTEGLESAGFVKIIDVKMILGQQIGFARLFFHPQNHCWAEVGQIFFKSRKPMPIAATMMSALDPDWSLSTSDRKIGGLLFGIGYMMRHPRTLWISKPGVTPRKLLQTHLQRLRQITSTLSLEVTELTDTSLEAYFAFRIEERIKRKQAFQRKNMMIGLIEALLFAVNPKQEWMGEYQDAVATKMRSGR